MIKVCYAFSATLDILTIASPPVVLLLTVPRRYFFCGSFLCLFLPTAMSAYCSLVVTCLERADPLAPLCMTFVCAFVALYRFWIFAFSHTLCKLGKKLDS